jgi:DNA-binding transcriptional MerR regulator
MDKSPDAFRTIREVAESMDLPQHVLRFWETRFPQIRPLKRGGGRRYYRPDDVELLRAIKHLLYGEGYTIKGVQKLIKEQGARAVAAGLPSLLAEEADETAYASPVAQSPTPVVAARSSLPPRIQPESRTASASAGKRGGSLSPDDFKALRGALEHIVEGQRILSLARSDSPG